MVDLASLVVRLYADSNRFRNDLDRATGQLNGFAGVAKKAVLAVVGVAVATGAAMIKLGKDAIDAADAMNDLAKQTGISTESLSQLKYAAEQSGTDLDGLTAGLRKFAKQAADAAGGGKEAIKSFALIGVQVKDASGKMKDSETLLLEVADAFAQYKDGAGKAAAAQDLFGKSGQQLIPLLNQGSAGIREMKKEANDLGLTISGSFAQAADDFNDSLNKIKQQLGGFGIQIAERFIKPIQDVTTAISDLLAKNKDISGFLEGLTKGFRLVAYLAVATADAFNDVGKLIGGLAAYTAILARDGYDAAERFQADFNKEALAREEATNEALARILGERGELYNKAAGPRRLGTYLSPAQLAANAKLSGIKTPELKDFPTEIAKQASDGIEEIEIKLKKIELPEDIYADMRENTQTALEKAFQEFRKRMADLEVLKIEGKDLENYDARKKGIEQDFKESIERLKKPVKELNEFTKEAARNTQDIIANTFESLANGADFSFKSILKSFGQMIIRLAAQAAAANLAGKLFGEAGGGTKGTTGWVGTAISAITGALGRDSGGRGQRGMAYMIGKGAQPEMFIPDSAGTFVPAGAGRASVTNNFTLVADGPVAKRTQLQIAAAAARGVDRASRRNN